MSETKYNQARWIIDRLSPNDFQTLCHFYLEDQEYKVQLGPMPGQDFAHDMYGSGPNGSFIAHSTTQKSRLEAKIRRDICQGVSNCTNLVQPKEEILYFTQSDRSEVFGTPVDEENFKSTLLSRLSDLDPRYSDGPPYIVFIYGDHLARDICAVRKTAYQYIQSQTIVKLHELEDEESLLLEEVPGDVPLSEEGLLRVISEYSDALPEELRRDLLQRLIESLWLVIVHHPFTARRLVSNELVSQGEFASLLVPLCNVGCHIPVKPDDLQSFFRTLWEDKYRFDGSRLHAHDLLATRMLKHMVYHQPESLSASVSEVGWN